MKHPFFSFRFSILAGLALTGGTAPATAATVLFSENFESAGVADGTFTSPGVGGSMGAFTVLVAGTNLLNPAASGGTSAWLNPVPVALGTTFGVMHTQSIIQVNLADTYQARTLYTLSFTNFRRDDVVGDAIAAQLLTPSIVQVAGAGFGAVAAQDTLVQREISVFIEADSPYVGQAISIRFFSDQSTNVNTLQAGIDNIVLTSIPEPSSFALLGLGCLCLLRRKRD